MPAQISSCHMRPDLFTLHTFYPLAPPRFGLVGDSPPPPPKSKKQSKSQKIVLYEKQNSTSKEMRIESQSSVQSNLCHVFGQKRTSVSPAWSVVETDPSPQLSLRGTNSVLECA